MRHRLCTRLYGHSNMHMNERLCVHCCASLCARVFGLCGIMYVFNADGVSAGLCSISLPINMYMCVFAV